LSVRSPHEATDGVLAPLNPVVSCVNRVPIQQPAADVPDVARIGCPGGNTDPLRDLPCRSLHVMAMHVSAVAASPNGWGAHTRSYLHPGYGADGREIAVFPWHPGRGRVALRHAHVKTLNDSIPTGKAHIPTGRVSPEVVVRMLIEDVAAEPLQPDRRRVLARTERDVIERRSWRNQPPLPGGPSDMRASSL